MPSLHYRLSDCEYTCIYAANYVYMRMYLYGGLWCEAVGCALVRLNLLEHTGYLPPGERERERVCVCVCV